MDHLSTKTSSTSRARFVDKNQGEKEGVDLRSEEEGRGQVGQRSVVLVPTESQGPHLFRIGSNPVQWQ